MREGRHRRPGVHERLPSPPAVRNAACRYRLGLAASLRLRVAVLVGLATKPVGPADAVLADPDLAVPCGPVHRGTSFGVLAPGALAGALCPSSRRLGCSGRADIV